MTVPNSTSVPAREPNKLVLCFDGTGNTFSGSNADTNVVKILNKLSVPPSQEQPASTADKDTVTVMTPINIITTKVR